MKIKNMGLKSIEARRFVKDFSQPMNIRIDHNSSIRLFSFKDNNEAHVEFEYVASYGSVGIIKLEGEFTYEGEDAQEVAKRWQEQKNMSNEIASHIHTSLMHFCLPEAVMIARDLKLPPPIPLPQVRFDKDAASAKGKKQFGPEVA